METENQKPTGTSFQPATAQNQPFAPGSTVIYGIHGKCSVLSIETRSIGGKSMSFYKLEPIKPPLSKSTRKDPAIWVPVENAAQMGLRTPSSSEDLDKIYELLANEDAFFDLKELWSAVQPSLEIAIRNEGIMGLAKVVGYLHLKKRKNISLPTDIQRYFDSVLRALVKEIVDITQATAKQTEELIFKNLKQKEYFEN